MLISNIYLRYFYIFLIFVFPVGFILGPAIPDIVCTLFAITMLYIIIRHKKYELIFQNWFWAFLFFVFVATISSLLSNYELWSLKSSFLYIRFGFFALFLSLFLSGERKVLNYLNIFILFLLTFVSIDMIYQYFIGVDFFNFPRPENRLSGPFGDELIPGSFVAKFSFPVAIYLLSKKNYFFLFFLVLMNLYFVSIALSAERGALIMFISGFLILLFFYFKKIIFTLSLISSIFIILYIAVISQNSFHNQRFVSTLDLYGFTSEKIIDSHWGSHYETAIRLFIKKPIIGIGANNFRHECSRKEFNLNISQQRDNRCTTHPHHIYIQLLSEVGIIGFISYLAFIFLSFKKIIPSLINDKLLISGYFISFLIILLPYIPSGNIFNNAFGALMFYFLGIAMIQDKSQYIL